MEFPYSNTGGILNNFVHRDVIKHILPIIKKIKLTSTEMGGINNMIRVVYYY